MTVALGTSTPTSITVVATSTSSSPRCERAHHRVLLVGGQPAVQHAQPQARQLALRQLRQHVEHRQRRTAAASRTPRRPGSSSASLGQLRVADPRAHDVGLVARPRPPRAPAATPDSNQDGRSAGGTTVVAIGDRPAGSSRSVEISRSPNTVIATVRGIGVAVITSMCGGSCAPRAAQRVALLDAEPVLLVDHDQARARRTPPGPGSAHGCRRRCPPRRTARRAAPAACALAAAATR